jgi:hypothetical protein
MRDGIGFPHLAGGIGLQVFGSDKVWTLDYAHQRAEIVPAAGFKYSGTGHVLTYQDGSGDNQAL